jgi:diacylglycerol kinase family enzyme
VKRKVHFIVNPVFVCPKRTLHILNCVFKQAEVDRDISLIEAHGDAEQFAREAAAGGVEIVTFYGNDGTVIEVAQRLLVNKVPMSILLGGSTNLIPVELDLPHNLERAATDESFAALLNSYTLSE